jgi:hypothetical protein
MNLPSIFAYMQKAHVCATLQAPFTGLGLHSSPRCRGSGHFHAVTPPSPRKGRVASTKTDVPQVELQSIGPLGLWLERNHRA